MKAGSSGPVKVLFVCVHNAGRSRMAEALLRRLGGSRFEVTSAGFDPREVNPLVVEALERVGLSLPTTAPQSSVFELYRTGRHFQYVIGVCDEQHGQKCPIFPGVSRRLNWSFPDPATFTGTKGPPTPLTRWMAWAMSSLPEPVSPVMRIGRRLGATASI